MTRSAFILLLCLLAMACGSSRTRSTDPAAGGGQATAELAILERFKSLDDEVEKSRGQCPRLATSIGRWLDGNTAELSALMEKSRAEPGVEGGDLERIEQQLERIFDRVLDAVNTCRGRGGVDQAYARFDAFLEAT